MKRRASPSSVPEVTVIPGQPDLGGLSPTAKGQLCRRSDPAELQEFTPGLVSASLPGDLCCLPWSHHGGSRQMIYRDFPSLTSYVLYFPIPGAFPGSREAPELLLLQSSLGSTAPAISYSKTWTGLQTTKKHFPLGSPTFRAPPQQYPCPVLIPKELLGTT